MEKQNIINGHLQQKYPAPILSKDGEQHRKCNYELPNYLY
jgi:hypothetical protein